MRVPYGDFFGVGHATCRHFVSLPLNMVFGSGAAPRGRFSASNNCYFPMPFGNSARILLINESQEPVANLFFYVDYELYTGEAPEGCRTLSRVLEPGESGAGVAAGAAGHGAGALGFGGRQPDGR